MTTSLTSNRTLSLAVMMLIALATVLSVAPAAAQGVVTVQGNRTQIGADGDGTADAPLEVIAGATTTAGTGNSVVLLRKSGDLAFQLDDTSLAGFWNFSVAASENEFRISKSGTGGVEMTLTAAGNLILRGNCSDVPGGGGCTADFVFEPEYELMSLTDLATFIDENGHLPNVPSAEHTRQNGLDLSYMNGRLLEKIEELTLYTLQQQETIEQLQQQVVELAKR